MFSFSFFFKAHLKLLQTTTCNCLFFYYVFLYFRRFSQLKMATRATSALFLLKILYIFRVGRGWKNYCQQDWIIILFYIVWQVLLLPLFSLSSFCHQTDQQPKKKYRSSSSEKRKLNRQNFSVLLVKRKCGKTNFFYGVISKRRERDNNISLEL